MSLAGSEVLSDLKTVKHGTDTQLLVRFYFNKVFEKIFVQINVPGDNRTQWDREATEIDKQRFAKQWNAYVTHANQYGDSALVDDLEFLSGEQKQMLKSYHIVTVEQLIGLSDSQMQNLGMGIREIIKKAQAWMANQNSDIEAGKLREKLAHAERQADAFKEQLKAKDVEIAAMMERLSSLEKVVQQTPRSGAKSLTKRRGRKAGA